MSNRRLVRLRIAGRRWHALAIGAIVVTAMSGCGNDPKLSASETATLFGARTDPPLRNVRCEPESDEFPSWDFNCYYDYLSEGKLVTNNRGVNVYRDSITEVDNSP
jgi:hypothetical protein